jgi:hypothetical protein
VSALRDDPVPLLQIGRRPDLEERPA